MSSLADRFLNDWVNEYERTEGELSEPNFDGVDTAYSDNKQIPHYIFNDGSVIMIMIKWPSKWVYIDFDNVQELEEEIDINSDDYSVYDWGTR